MALYLGDTEVAPVIEVPVPEKRYNIGINNLMGTVDENGMYVLPTEPFTPDFSNVKDLPANALTYKFYQNTLVTGDIVFGFESLSGSYAMNSAFQRCSNLTSVSFPALTTISGGNALTYAFGYCTSLTSISFPQLATISGGSAMNSTFQNCSKLTSVSFPQLATISGGSAMSVAFQRCSNLTSVSFPALTTISGSYAMSFAFEYCPKLTSIAFPALKEILPETTQTHFNNTFNGCTALTEIHFPAAMQARIEQLNGYANKFGATNATIYFDL